MITTDLDLLRAADPATCDREALVSMTAAAQRMQSWLDGLMARVAHRAQELSAAGVCEPAAVLLQDDGRRSSRSAKAVVARGEVCALVPELGEALSSGVLSAGHVDAVARVASRAPEAVRAELAAMGEGLVVSAAERSVEGFERHVRELERRVSQDDGVCHHERLKRQRSLRRWVDRRSGMCHTHVALDPENDARLSAVLDTAVAEVATTPEDRRSFDQRRADAFLAVVTGSPVPGARRPPEISVLIDLDTLQDELHAAGVCETADGELLPPDVIRRLACGADILPVVLGGDGTALDVGRSRRVATEAQRHALRAMYRTCGHPGCQVRFGDCDIHHVVPWNRAGRTELANLLPLCSEHHHLVHEGHWQLTLHADRRMTLRRPDGTVHFVGTTVDVHSTHSAPTAGAPGAKNESETTDVPVGGPSMRAPAA